jgi:hypothetical protein
LIFLTNFLLFFISLSLRLPTTNLTSLPSIFFSGVVFSKKLIQSVGLYTV